MSQDRIALRKPRVARDGMLAALLVVLAVSLAGTRGTVAGPPPGAAGNDGKESPLPTDHEDRVTVRLAEIQVLVTDRQGNPVTDLRPEEVTVYERGRKRRLAFLEPFTNRGAVTIPLPEPTPLVEKGKEAPEPAERAPVIPPPPPRRRIVLLFDLWNSRTQDRKRWVRAAREWIESQMRPSDLVALAALETSGRVRMLLNFTSEKDPLLAILGDGSFVESVPYQDWMMDIRRLLDDLQTCVNAYEPDFCSESAVQPYLHEWRVRGEMTLAGLSRFAASLGAIPGRKVILYMSAGILPNPGQAAVDAILATFGTDVISMRNMSFRLQRDLNREILDMLRVANGADVTFFTFDTRPSSLRDSSWTAEQRVMMHERQFMDPFSAMFDSTRGSLDTLALRTGGRAFHGPRIERNLPLAVRAIEGLYTVGFYRDPKARGLPKVKVKIARRRLRISYPDRYDPRKKLPRSIPLELAIGKTRPLERGFLLPVMIQAEATYLRFQKEGKGYHADLAVYVEAVRPDGTIAGESYQVVGIDVDERRYEQRAGLRFAHQVGLILPAGGYRIRVRLADADFRVTAERAIDVTVRDDGSVSPGIQNSVRSRKSGSREEVAPAGGTGKKAASR